MLGFRIDFDPVKDAENRRKHGVSLAMAEKLDWDNAVCWSDDRFSYSEQRMSCFAFLGVDVYHVTYTERGGVYRIISLRPATRKERKVYAGLLGY